MSTRFEKKIIMPKGSMGITTLMGLSKEDRKSVERWHRREWDEFREEVVAYKHRMLDATRSAYMRLWERAQKCEKCRKRRAAMMNIIKGRKQQRGSIILGGAVTASAGPGNEGTDCSFTTSTIPNLNDFEIEPSNAYTRARLHSDGNWYWNENSSWTSRGTWDGDCAIADYDTQWNRVSGNVPNNVVSGTDGVWAAATTSKAVGYTRSFGVLSGSFNMVCRDGTTLNTLFTDSYTMDCEVESKN